MLASLLQKNRAFWLADKRSCSPPNTCVCLVVYVHKHTLTYIHAYLRRLSVCSGQFMGWKSHKNPFMSVKPPWTLYSREQVYWTNGRTGCPGRTSLLHGRDLLLSRGCVLFLENVLTGVTELKTKEQWDKSLLSWKKRTKTIKDGVWVRAPRAMLTIRERKTYTVYVLIQQSEKMPLLSSLWETEGLTLNWHKQILLYPVTVCETFV